MNGYEVGDLEGGSSLGSELKASANLARTSGQGWKQSALEGEEVPFGTLVETTLRALLRSYHESGVDGLGIHGGKPWGLAGWDSRNWVCRTARGCTCFVGGENKLSAISTGLIGLLGAVQYIEEISFCRVRHPTLTAKLHGTIIFLLMFTIGKFQLATKYQLYHVSAAYIIITENGCLF